MSYTCQVDRHGAHHLELELSYPLPKNESDARYGVEVFLFTPTALGLTRERYGVQGFLHDVKSYTRCDLCALPLSKLVDPACAISPITRLNKLLAGMVTERDLDEAKVLYELKTLVNLHHDELRARRDLFRQQLKSGLPESGLRNYLAAYQRDHEALVGAVRSYYPTFVDPRVPEAVRQALRLADESISIKAEKELHHLCSLLEEFGQPADLIAPLEQMIAREQDYRRRMEFASVTGPDYSVQNEAYVYRESNLKKWAQSATYMTMEAARTPARVGHLLAGVAAALAMAFAVAAAVVTQMFFDMNSLPWAILIIVSYMLKDRIKEMVRNGLINLIPTMVADRVVRLTDPRGGDDVGRSRERVRFFESGEAPPDILNMRRHLSESFRAILPPEQVIQFSKVLLLDSDKLLQNHQRVVGLKEIIRINLGSWLSQMDDPVDELFTLAEGQRRVVKTLRVYHINMIVRLTERKSDQAFGLFKYRVILTRNGIERVEMIS